MSSIFGRDTMKKITKVKAIGVCYNCGQPIKTGSDYRTTYIGNSTFAKVHVGHFFTSKRKWMQK